MNRPVALIGMPGCGKTSAGRAAAGLAGLPFVDVDERIEALYGPVPALFAEGGEPHFRACERRALEAVLAEGPAIIATGGGIVTEAASMALIKTHALVVYIDRPLECILGDIDMASRPLLAGGAEALRALYTAREPLYRRYADHTIPNDGSIEEVSSRIAALIREENA